MIVAEKFLPGIERQLERFDAALEQGMPRRGWKIAINVPEVLKHLDLPHSGIGWLDGHRVLSSGDPFPAPANSQLLIEPEVAIQIAQDVAPRCSLDEARAAIGSLCPALEIVDYTNPGAGFDDVVASCMFHCASVLGTPQPLDVAQELGVEWPVLTVDDTQAEPPRADLVPADLAELVVFVSEFLAEFDRGLVAGDMILSGSYTAKALAISPGQQAIARHGALGEVCVRIT